MEDKDTQAAVLVVDDEREVADLYAAALDDSYAVQTAYGGEEALELLVFEPDVILLDRRMPGMCGAEVLDAVRARGLDVRVAMVSAVRPDFDVLEMPFDDYLVKPVGPDELRETVDQLLLLDRLEAKQVELRSKRVTCEVLRREKSEGDLAENDRYSRLREEIARLESEIDHLRSQLGEDHPSVAVSA